MKGTIAIRRERFDLLFEFCVKGLAVTWRAGSRGEKGKNRLRVWREAVERAAQTTAGGRSAFTRKVDIEIVEFSERQRLDRDNMAKPVLDALQGILYKDDVQVSRLHIEWCNLEGSYRVRYMPFVVAAALSEGAPFVWVRVLRHRPRKALFVEDAGR